MSVFAEAIEAVKGDSAAASATPAPAETPEASGSSPESTAAPSGTAPSTPQPQQQTPSPQGARTPTTPQQRPALGEQGKQVDLRALQEARSQTKSLRDTYGWLPREHVGQFKAFYSAFTADPLGAILGELESLASQPQGRQRVQAALAQWGIGGTTQPAANGKAAPPAGDDPEPQPDYRLADGSMFYSATRQAEWRAWHARQDEKRFEEKIAPIQNFVTAQQREQVRAAATANANQFAERVFAEAKTWPHFTENKPAIAAKFTEYSERMNAEAALYRAYLSVMHETVLPSLSQSERVAVKNELASRAKATTPNPTRPTGQRPNGKAEDFRDAAQRILGGAR